MKSLADPGEPWGPRPPCPQDFFKIMHFSGNFEQILGSGLPPWGQNSAEPPDQSPGSASESVHCLLLPTCRRGPWTQIGGYVFTGLGTLVSAVALCRYCVLHWGEDDDNVVRIEEDRSGVSRYALCFSILFAFLIWSPQPDRQCTVYINVMLLALPCKGDFSFSILWRWVAIFVEMTNHKPGYQKFKVLIPIHLECNDICVKRALGRSQQVFRSFFALSMKWIYCVQTNPGP